MDKLKTQPLILAIDTSCDETAAAVTRGVTVVSNVVASQAELHRPYGGVFPTVAKQAHKENINQTIAVALKRARVTADQLDAIAVTQGPGLAPALEVGISKAKELAIKDNKPLIAINHIEAHVLSPLAQRNQLIPKSETVQPLTNVLSLVISGGHSEFVLINEVGSYERLGWTIDDAAGECLDKVGRMLDLGYPAGPVIEQFAKKGDTTAYDFPLPMTTSGDYNLSFSGMKTHSRNLIEKLTANGHQLSAQQTYDFCASFQRAVFRHITYKLEKVLADYPQITAVFLGGGVAANMTLRKAIRETLKKSGRTLQLHVPYSKRLCGDNAAMIGITASFKYQRHEFVKDMTQLERKPRWEVD
ncbi:MAG TPA: tRNA (adenosine(37)-N6)-threonylcarbamoyltransferase complex transferase subunit TsaD [Patescibacteria group bacterium]